MNQPKSLLHRPLIRVCRVCAPTLLLLAGSLDAQGVHALPSAAYGAFAGDTGQTPLGPYPMTFQFWYHGQNLPPGAVLNAISLRADATQSSPAYTQTQEIWMANTPATLGPNLAANRGPTPVLVLPSTTIMCPAHPGGGNPNAGTCWIRLAQPFVFTGPHLLIEIRVTSLVTLPAGRMPTNDFFQMFNTSVFHAASGVSCGGTLAASHTGTAYTLTATGIGPTHPAWLMIGTENVLGVFGPLPLDLAPFGMPGCSLGVQPFALVLVTANGSGTATLSIPHNLGTSSIAVFAQAAHPAMANPAGWTTTNVTNSVLGNTGLCNMLVSSNGVTADSGFPRTWNAAPVFLWR